MADHPARADWRHSMGMLAAYGRRLAGYLDRNVSRIIAIAVVLLTAIASLAWCEARRASELAQSTLDVTRQSLVVLQRAGVYFQGLQFTAAENDGRPLRWHVGPVWENTGATATQDLTFELTCPRVAGRGDRDRVDPYELRSAFASLFMSSMLGPKQSQVGGVCEVTPEEMERVKDGRLALFLVAVARYKDTLDAKSAHETWQCLRIASLNGTFDSTEGPAPSYSALPCGSRPNCADEGCKKK